MHKAIRRLLSLGEHALLEVLDTLDLEWFVLLDGLARNDW